VAKQLLAWRKVLHDRNPAPERNRIGRPAKNRAFEGAEEALAAERPAPKRTMEITDETEKAEKRISRLSLEEGIRDLETCVREVGRGRMGPIRREARHIVIGLRAIDKELYYLRIATRNYRVKPPSCKFVDEKGKSASSAWPAYESSGPFRPPTFICTPPTAEFYEYHDERKYNPKDGTLVNAVCTIFAALNSEAYNGRFEPGKARSRNRGRRLRPWLE
jgi:hypothetical protein